MDIPTSAVTGAARVVLQVVTAQQRPVLEFYVNLRNRVGPEEVMSAPGVYGAKDTEHRWRPQDIFLEFLLVNIGGLRAEGVSLKLNGDFAYKSSGKKLSRIKVFQDLPIPQIAPAQVFPLFRLDVRDLYTRDVAGESTGDTEPGFSITADYNGPSEGLNAVRKLPARIRGRQQFTTIFTFDPAVYDGLDLPTAEYV